MDLLDQILSQTRTEYSSMDKNIVSEQHDTNKIDYGGSAAVDAAMSRRPGGSGGWDAAEYGMSLQEAQARWDAAQTPEERARVEADLRQRAIARAGLDTTGGRVRVMVAGSPPWHKLGVNVAEAVDSAEAERLSGTDFTVSKRKLSYAHDGNQVEQDEAFAIVRDDTGAFLGSVGSRYKPIQNQAAFAFMDTLLGEFGAKYETAGSIHGGKKVWMQVKLPRSCFSVANGDKVESFAIFTNPHDGSGKAWCFATSERVVCGNTLRIACKSKEKGIGMRHTGDIKAKIADARNALGMTVKGFETFQKTATYLAKTSVKEMFETPRKYVDAVLDECCDVKYADVKAGPELTARRLFPDVSPEDFQTSVEQCQKQIMTRGEILADILHRFESERCKVNGVTGTVWAALNSVTEHADYSNIGRQVGNANERLSRRFESVLIGNADDMKQAAYSVATRA